MIEAVVILDGEVEMPFRLRAGDLIVHTDYDWGLNRMTIWVHRRNESTPLRDMGQGVVDAGRRMGERVLSRGFTFRDAMKLAEERHEQDVERAERRGEVTTISWEGKQALEREVKDLRSKLTWWEAFGRKLRMLADGTEPPEGISDVTANGRPIGICPLGTEGCIYADCGPAPGHSCTGPDAPQHVDMGP